MNRGWGKQLVWTTLGVLAVAISARLTIPVPGSPVPQSAQTLTVVLFGAWMGARGAALTLVAYALVGALGVPVFSDGGSGWSQLVGPTGGYIMGFVVAAAVVGWCADTELIRRPVPAFGTLLLGHAVILAFGWGWLAVHTSAWEAYANGVEPFILGGIVKSALAVVVVMGWATSFDRSAVSAGPAPQGP